MESETLIKAEDLASLQKSLSHHDSSPPAKSYQRGRTKKPKRNKSAFILFSIGMRAKLKTDSGDQLNSNEMMVKLAELWKNLPKAEREAYHTEARDDKLRYLKELDNFSKNHPSESIHNRTKKNHVKKPCSAYAIFLREKKSVIKEDKPDLKMADILKIVSEQWKNLTEEERVIYKDKAQQEKETVRIKLGENMDKAKNSSLKPGPTAAKKVKTQDQSSDHHSETREPKVPFKIGSTGDLRLRLDHTNLSNRSFDRSFSTMATLRTSEVSSFPIPTFSLSSLLNFPIADPNPNKDKDADLDEGGRSLLKLFDKAVQKSSELLLDLINFNLPTERFDTLDITPKTPSIKPNFSALLSQLLSPSNLEIPNRQELLNENIVKALKNSSQGSSEQKESSSPEVQVENLSPPKVS